MKRILCFALLTVICLMAVSCGKSSEIDPPDGMKLASNEDDLFYFFVPNGWTADRGYGNPYAFVSGSDNSNVNVMFHLLEKTPVSDGTREPYIDAYWEEFEKSVEKGFYSYSLIEEECKDCTLGGGDIFAKQYVYKVKNMAEEEFKCRAVVTYHGQMICCLTYTSTVENYDSHKVDVDKIISEFKFK